MAGDREGGHKHRKDSHAKDHKHDRSHDRSEGNDEQLETVELRGGGFT